MPRRRSRRRFAKTNSNNKESPSPSSVKPEEQDVGMQIGLGGRREERKDRAEGDFASR